MRIKHSMQVKPSGAGLLLSLLNYHNNHLHYHHHHRHHQLGNTITNNNTIMTIISISGDSIWCWSICLQLGNFSKEVDLPSSSSQRWDDHHRDDHGNGSSLQKRPKMEKITHRSQSLQKSFHLLAKLFPLWALSVFLVQDKLNGESLEQVISWVLLKNCLKTTISWRTVVKIV